VIVQYPIEEEKGSVGSSSLHVKHYPILDGLRDSDSDEFASECKRFFEKDYVRIKAQNMLRHMLSRHGNDEGFFTYADKRFCLAASFSDPFVNGLWAVDIGLLPVARAMLNCLARSKQS